MNFDTYRITHPYLAKYVQYILFNNSNTEDTNCLITSYANNNICLGIIKDGILSDNHFGEKKVVSKTGIHSYISGIYLSPHIFRAKGILDEICIDFTPEGFHKFFRFKLKAYLLNEDILVEGWGKEAHSFFEKVFSETNVKQRGKMIEAYLLKKLFKTDPLFLEECLYRIHKNINTTLQKLSKDLNCSEKKIVRIF